MPHYLTFDIGTTALKTALVDDAGRLLNVHTAEYTFESPHPDWAEMAPERYWNAAIEGTRAVFEASGADRQDLVAVGFSSQGQTFVPVDRSGAILHNAIVWTDKRAASVAADWEANWLSRDEYARISGYPWVPSELTVFKLAWMAENAPEAHRAWRFLLLPDFLIYRMTGETATDPVTAQSTGMFDIQTGDWEPRLLSAAGVTREQLPQVLPCGTPTGRMLTRPAEELGVPVGVPVCVGANDQIVGAVGAGNVRPGVVSETTGTALAAVATTRDVLKDTRMCVGRHAVPGMWFAMPFATTSAIVLKWFRDLCFPDEDYDTFLSGVEDIAAGSDGLTVLPHFSGTASPSFNPEVRGAITGLTLAHTRLHIARAIMESCCCELRECLDLIRASGRSMQSVRSLGGAARSDLWLQMKADMIGIPVERPLYSDAASLGAAMLAAAGTGRFSSIYEASDEWYRSARRFEPNPALAGVYQEVYQRYLRLYAQLYG